MIYVGSPFADDPDKAVRLVLDYMRLIWADGATVPFSPVEAFWRVAKNNTGHDPKWWMQLCNRFLPLARSIHIIVGEDGDNFEQRILNSCGTMAEIAYAHLAGIPLYFVYYDRPKGEWISTTLKLK